MTQPILSRSQIIAHLGGSLSSYKRQKRLARAAGIPTPELTDDGITRWLERCRTAGILIPAYGGPHKARRTAPRAVKTKPLPVPPNYLTQREAARRLGVRDVDFHYAIQKSRQHGVEPPFKSQFRAGHNHAEIKEIAEWVIAAKTVFRLPDRFYTPTELRLPIRLSPEARAAISEGQRRLWARRKEGKT